MSFSNLQQGSESKILIWDFPKKKSKHILQMNILLEDCLAPDNCDATDLTPHQVTKDIIQEFKGKFLNFIQKLNRKNFNYDLNNKPAQWHTALMFLPYTNSMNKMSLHMLSFHC